MAHSVYREPSVRAPTLEQLSKIAEKNGMSVDHLDLIAYHKSIKATCEAISDGDALQEPTLPTLYPRTPGYRPTPDENTLNGWYWKTDIAGANCGKLLGKTLAIKDIIAVAGVPMNFGCAATEGYIPEYDATVVTRILSEGGRIIGKSTCSSFCDAGTSFTSIRGPVKNYRNPLHDAGGSSGGSGTLVAAGEVDLAVGSDQGGSVRLPACWCGIVGLKPTFGLIPYTGTMSLEPSVDYLGPMTSNVHDCALLTEVLAGYDGGLDPRQRPDVAIPEYTKEMLISSLDGYKVGLLKEGFGWVFSDSHVDEIVRNSVMKLREVGAVVEEASVPLHRKGSLLWTMACTENSTDTLHRTGGVGRLMTGFHSTSMSGFILNSLRSRINDIPHSLKSSYVFSEYLAESYPGVVFNKGQNLRRSLTKEYDQALKTYDVLAMPTIPFTAPLLPTKDLTTEEYLNCLKPVSINTRCANLTGHPAISLNAGYHNNGLPVGVMFVGRHYDEVTIFRVASQFESLTK